MITFSEFQNPQPDTITFTVTNGVVLALSMP